MSHGGKREGAGKPKGQPRPPGSGRQKGTPNKKTQAFIDLCEQRGFNPGEALILIAQTAEDESIRFAATKEACSFVYPKRKAVEVTGKDGEKLPSHSLMTAENVALWIGIAQRDKP